MKQSFNCGDRHVPDTEHRTYVGVISPLTREVNSPYPEFHTVPFLMGVSYERPVNSHPLSGLPDNVLGQFAKGAAA